MLRSICVVAGTPVQFKKADKKQETGLFNGLNKFLFQWTCRFEVVLLLILIVTQKVLLKF